MKSEKKVPFVKMAGAGNDFIIITEFKKGSYAALGKRMCDRTNGIGADGLLVLGPSKKADYHMRIINADGSQAEMCGNGVRCLSAFIQSYLKPKKKLFTIETIAGIIYGEAKGEIAHVRLSNPKNYRANIPLKLGKRTIHVHYIDTGVPHTIVYVDNLSKIDVDTIGRKVRFHSKFKPRGTNVNFVEQVNAGLVAARTYERGVEGETKACGTGSVAAALVSCVQSHPNKTEFCGAKIGVRTKSGEVLRVTFDYKNGKFSNVWLKGSAKFIAHGIFLK